MTISSRETRGRYKFAPGHPQAAADGCICPAMDNGHGAGCGYVDAQGRPLYVFDLTCPLHGGDNAERSATPLSRWALEMNPDEYCFNT